MRIFLTTIVTLLLIQTLVNAYPRPKEMRVTPTPPLVGTTFTARVGKTVGATFTFHADGTLTYRSSRANATTSPGKWLMKDGLLTFDVNNYTRWSCSFVGNELHCDVVNPMNQTWKAVLVPMEMPGKQ